MNWKYALVLAYFGISCGIAGFSIVYIAWGVYTFKCLAGVQ